MWTDRGWAQVQLPECTNSHQLPPGVFGQKTLSSITRQPLSIVLSTPYVSIICEFLDFFEDICRILPDFHSKSKIIDDTADSCCLGMFYASHGGS